MGRNIKVLFNFDILKPFFGEKRSIFKRTHRNFFTSVSSHEAFGSPGTHDRNRRFFNIKIRGFNHQTAPPHKFTSCMLMKMYEHVEQKTSAYISSQNTEHHGNKDAQT